MKMGDTKRYDKTLVVAEDSQEHLKKECNLPSMPTVEFVSELSSCEADFLSIENNTNIAIVAVRTISRLIFGLKDG